MNSALRVAAIQLNCQASTTDNLNQCERLVAQAATAGAELVLLPENFAYLGPEAGRLAVAEVVGDVDAPVQQRLGAMARQHGVTLVGGGMPERRQGGPPYNTAVVYGPSGELVAAYRKLHLFDVELPTGKKFVESATTSAGDAPLVFDLRGFRIGLSICYDLRFPELYRALVDLGAEVLLVPAAFTYETGQYHWQVLLRARAIESQCYVLAAAQWGDHPEGRKSYGDSCVVDPWGTVMSELTQGTGLVVAELDKSRLEAIRDMLPSLRHRRL